MLSRRIVEAVVLCMRYTETDLMEYEECSDPSLQNTKSIRTGVERV